MYRRIEHLRDVNTDLKALISIGGWNEGSDKYSKMASSPDSRKRFIASVLTFLKDNKFDGLDVDWEYPGFKASGEEDRTPGNPKDKQNFVTLLRELRAALKPHNYLLTAAVSAGKPTIDVSYDVKELDQLLDFVNVMAYDFHGGAWEEVTGHNAPLYADPKADEKQKMLTVSYAVEYWLKQGLSPKKLIMGMATYGRSFTLADPANHGIGAKCAPGSKGGNKGPYTDEVGTLGYNEICEFLKAGWTAYRDSTQKIVYAVKGNQWVGYDDEQTFQDKLSYLKAKGLGGAMVWSIDTDDFHGYCGPLKHPLIKTISRELNGITGTPDPVIH
ncbi:unnamed protein product, partial [Medioppia subpectinata]